MLGHIEDYVNPAFGVQATGGSSSISAHYMQLRQAGADTRALIIDAAAKDLGVSKHDIRTEDAHIIVNGDRHPYGQFVATAATLTASEDSALKSNQ